MTNDQANNSTERVWRYMGLARYLWLLQFKRLWLSRADLLGDPWEIPLTDEHVAFLRARNPIGGRVGINQPREPFEERTSRVVTNWRQTTYVNCWCRLRHESHALWRVYCGANEGVAIQTSFDKLRISTPDFDVFPVRYGLPEVVTITPIWQELVATKRPMFEYESEVRIVARKDNPTLANLVEGSPGYGFDWDPEKYLDAVCVHPEADSAFMDIVANATAQNAPLLKDRVVWSKMRDRPPFWAVYSH